MFVPLYHHQSTFKIFYLNAVLVRYKRESHLGGLELPTFQLTAKHTNQFCVEAGIKVVLYYQIWIIE